MNNPPWRSNEPSSDREKEFMQKNIPLRKARIQELKKILIYSNSINQPI